MFLAVRISSYGCTWEVWRALKKLELLSAAPRATLTLLSCPPNFPSASITRYTHAKHEPILKWLNRPIAFNGPDLQHHRLTNTIHLTVKMTSAHVVETSVKNKFLSELPSPGRSYNTNHEIIHFKIKFQITASSDWLKQRAISEERCTVSCLEVLRNLAQI